VLNRLVGDGELAEVVSNHFWLDFNGVEGLSVVDTNDAADHLGDNDHVSEVGLDNFGLLTLDGLAFLKKISAKMKN